MGAQGLFRYRFSVQFPTTSDDGPEGLSNQSVGKSVSAWSRSVSKRIFDVVGVLVAAPLVLPVCLCVAIAVRLTSRGPALFKQARSGLNGVTFTIFKFRTMKHQIPHKPEAALNRTFTWIGPFLRRSKLDELPQLLNVLLGDMSLVGPRPKLPEHQLGIPCSRPGITGAATLIFANEEAVLANISPEAVEQFFRSVVLPAKLHLDQTYMAQATFRSDLELIIRTVFRRWNNRHILDLLGIERFATTQTCRLPAGSTKLEFATEEASGID